MKVRYIGPHDAVDVLGQTVASGDVIDVRKADAERLLEQGDNWQHADNSGSRD